MKRALLFILWFWCGVPALLLGQGYSKLTVDFVETNRRCRDDAAVVRRCNVAYGHYTLPSEWGGVHYTYPPVYSAVCSTLPILRPRTRTERLLSSGRGPEFTGGIMLIDPVVLTTAIGTNSMEISRP